MMQFAMMPLKLGAGSKQEQALIDHDRLDSLTQEFKVSHHVSFSTVYCTIFLFKPLLYPVPLPPYYPTPLRH